MALPARPAALARDEVYRTRYLIAFAVTLASMLELVDTSIVNVAIPHMMGNLGATLEEVAWVSTGYIVANVIVLPLTSWLSGRFGRRNYYTGSILLFTAASVFCGAARSLEGLVFWRVVQGIGGGELISTASASASFSCRSPARRWPTSGPSSWPREPGSSTSPGIWGVASGSP